MMLRSGGFLSPIEYCWLVEEAYRYIDEQYGELGQQWELFGCGSSWQNKVAAERSLQTARNMSA